MKWRDSGTQFENPPSGSHIGVCYSLVDLGTQHRPAWQNEERAPARMVRISFELPEEKMTGKYNKEVKGKPFAVHTTAKQSMHPKANLRKLLEGWRGKKFGEGEVEKFDPKKLVGLPCRLTLIENGDYINVDSISPLGKGDKKPKKLVNAAVFLSLEPDEFDQVVFDALHDKTKEKIAKSPEFQALNGDGSEGQGEQGDAPEEGHEAAEPESDDVPF